MKRLLLFSLLFHVIVFAQKHDYIWMMGVNLANGDTTNPNFSITQLDFNTAPLSVYRVYRPLEMSFGSNAICNKEGQLQFYSNGRQVNDYNNNAMPNGFGLNPGYFYSSFTYSYPSTHGCMIIPKPDCDSIYYMFYAAWEVGNIGSFPSYCNRLYCNIVDMRLRSGMGDVSIKNQIIIDDTLIGGGYGGL